MIGTPSPQQKNERSMDGAEWSRRSQRNSLPLVQSLFLHNCSGSVLVNGYVLCLFWFKSMSMSALAKFVWPVREFAESLLMPLHGKYLFASVPLRGTILFGLDPLSCYNGSVWVVLSSRAAPARASFVLRNPGPKSHNWPWEN